MITNNQTPKKMNIIIAYIHAMSFPSVEANAFDSMWSAAALSRYVNATFFVPKLKTSVSKTLKYYSLSDTRLNIRQMHLGIVPDRIILMVKNFYERVLSLYLRFNPNWLFFKGIKVIYVREPRELIYWGNAKKNKKWLKEWILCYEAHDFLGLDPNELLIDSDSTSKKSVSTKEQAIVLEAASNFDVMICNTRILAEDIRIWSKNRIETHFVSLASSIPRLKNPPAIQFFGERILLGYIGTIDQFRGVNVILEAMHYVPDNVRLRLVGRFREEKNVDPNWLNKYLEDPKIKDKVEIDLQNPIMDVASEIDRCDIVIQPASNDILDSRYAAPLKAYGYMLRGKPIVTADVLCHRELFEEDESAVFYKIDPQSLSSCIIRLANNPQLAEKIAVKAWKQSELYNPARRAENVIKLISMHGR